MSSSTPRFSKEEYLAEAKDIFKAAEQAAAVHYRSNSGMEYSEEPGTYNDYMVRAMARDMLPAYLALKNTPFADRVKSWMPKMTAFNTEIMRMFDDLKGDRPVKAQNLKKWKKLRAEIEDIAGSPEVHTSYFKNLPEKMKTWVDRLGYQMDWICVLRQKYKLHYLKMELGWEEDGKEVSPATGLSKEEESVVTEICKTREVLLKTFLKLPQDSPEHESCKKRLEDLDRAVDTIMNHAGDDFKEQEELKLPVFQESDPEKENELTDVLTAISVVAKLLSSEMSGKKVEDLPLEDRITACKVILKRIEEKRK